MFSYTPNNVRRVVENVVSLFHYTFCSSDKIWTALRRDLSSLLDHAPPQVTLTVSQIMWCRSLTEILEGDIEENRHEEMVMFEKKNFSVSVFMSVRCAVCGVRYVVSRYRVPVTLYAVQCTACTVYTVRHTVYTIHCVLQLYKLLIEYKFKKTLVLFQDLNKLASIVRQNISKLARLVIGALITLDVHGRDMVTSMVKNQVRLHYLNFRLI